MTELVAVLQRYAVWLYLLLAALGLRQIHLLWRASREHGTSLFGLEREAATGKAVRALVSLMLYLTIGLGVYSVSTAELPGAPRREGPAPAILQTPPTAAIATDTPTPRPATDTPVPVRIVTRAPEASPSGP